MTWNTQGISFQGETGSFFRGMYWAHRTPATGTTYRMKWNERRLSLDNTATVAALTVLLPLGADENDEVEIYAQSAVTALTLQTGLGGAVAGAPTTLAAGSNTTLFYRQGAWIVGVGVGA